MANLWSSVTIDCINPQRVSPLLERPPWSRARAVAGGLGLPRRSEAKPSRGRCSSRCLSVKPSRCEFTLDVSVDDIDEAMAEVVSLGGRFTGLELRYIEANQADVDAKEAEALSILIGSLNDVPQACVRVGAIFLVKFLAPDGPVILARSLSQLEIRALERYPEIQMRPRNALAALANAVLSMEDDPMPRMVLERPVD